MNKLVNILIIVSMVFTVGCSTTGLSKQEKNSAYADYLKTNEIASVDRVTAFNFSGWQALTDDYLIISASQRKKYLIEINGFCPDLSFSTAILMHQSMSSTLSTRSDAISTVDTPQLKCYIQSIYKITKAQAKEISDIGESPQESEK